MWTRGGHWEEDAGRRTLGGGHWEEDIGRPTAGWTSERAFPVEAWPRSGLENRFETRLDYSLRFSSLLCRNSLIFSSILFSSLLLSSVARNLERCLEVWRGVLNAAESGVLPRGVAGNLERCLGVWRRIWNAA